ncbi:WD40-repeat-containing domain protein [Aspergillus granulosus]|uniref:WD40-repeat-containing domain protein n=1 Tax=Aspergillus granulosus TaxID=176169 RepID=A0ABR4GZR7_9EURO
MPTLDPTRYTVAWIAPLEIEVQAARHMLDKVHSGGFPVGPGDDYLFHAGEIHGHNVVIATFAAGQRYGTNSATSLASHVKKFFPNLWFGLLVGVAAGLPNHSCSPPRDIRLGDVIVAYSPPSGDPPAIVPYGLGKQKGGDDFELLCNGRHLPQTERIVGSAIGKIKAEKRDTQVILGYYRSIAETATQFPDPGQENDLLYLSDDNQPVPRQHRPDAERTRVWYGSIGSGDRLLKSRRHRDAIRDKYNVIGLEMEAAGVLNEIPVGNIRGVCDYGDEQKNKDWQPYAAAMAAAFAKAVLLEISPKSVAQSAGVKTDFTDKDNSCLRDLLVADPETERRRIEATKGGLLDDSFRWVLDNAEFQKWHTNSESQLLWIKGDPGKGKTMLMIGIIKELLRQAQSEPSQSIAYFLCQATDPKLNNATSILRSLIYMLIRQQPHLMSHLRERYDTDPKLFESGNLFYSLSATFEKMVQSSTAATIYLLIDALDECELDLPELLQFITATKSTSSVQVKWVVSSRNRDDIEQALQIDNQKHKLSLELNANHISNAVAAYINYKVSQLTALQHNKLLLQQVKDQLLQKSDGTFLWVALVVQEIQKHRLSAAMVELLDTTPRGLTPLYDRMLRQILLFESLYQELCILVLSIVTLGYRPLHLHELCLLAGLQKQQYSSGDLDIIVRMCGSFLTIRDNYVYLVHQSAKDYLGDAKVSAAIFPSGPSAMHYRIFRESLQNLSTKLRRNIYNLNLDNPGVSVSQIATFRPDPDPLLELRYSCTYWLDHLLKAISTSADQLNPILDFFRKHLLHWLESLSLIGEIRHGILALRKLVHQQQKEVSRQPNLDEHTIKRRRMLDGGRVSSFPVSDQFASYKQLFKEFERFASSYAYIIQEAPLQTYSAALAFCPQASESKELYWRERLEFLERAFVMSEAWDPCMQVLDGHTGWVTAVAFSPDGQTVASISYDGTVRLWDPATGVECRTLQGHTDSGHTDSVTAVAFSPDGQTVASASYDGTVRLWDPATGVECRTLQGHTGRVTAVAFSPDGQTVASASYDGTVRLWDPATGVKRRTLQGHTGRVLAVAFSPDGQTVASASHDGTVRLWDPDTGVERCVLQGHARWVTPVAFSPDGQTVASVPDDGTVRLWDPATGVERRTLQGHTDSVLAVAFSPDGQTVASAPDDGTVRLWDPATGVKRRTLQGHTGRVLAVAFSPDGQTVASASHDGTVRLWDPATGVERCVLQGHTDSVTEVAFSPDGQTVASASYDGTVRLWDPATGVKRRTPQGHTGWVTAVAFSPDGQTVASASEDHTVQLWDPATGVERCVLQGHTDWVTAVAFSPDGQTVASASYDGTVRLWDPATGVKRRTLQGHTGRVLAVAFSPDGQTVASASEDHTVQLWDPATGVECRTLQGHTDSVTAVAFSPDGQTVASASYDGTVRLWDPATGIECRTLQGHTDFVTAVAFSPDGQTVASASYDGTVRLWDLATGIEKEKRHLNVVVTTLLFSDNGCLNTDRGSLSLDHQPHNSYIERQENDIFVHEKWITHNGQRLIWLPPDYRATRAAANGNSVVLGHRSGRLTFLLLT